MGKKKKELGFDSDGAKKVMRKRDYMADMSGQWALGLMANVVGQLTYFYTDKVGLLETWDVIAPVWLEYVAVTVLSTWIVMIISGKVTQSVIRHRKKGVQENHV